MGKFEKPSILIDFKKKRIIISKKWIQAISDPQYIILLINPETRTLAILKSDGQERNTHCIRPTKGSCIELYSSFFLNSLLKLNEKCQDGFTYKIYGEVFQDDGIIKYEIDNAMLGSKKE